MTGIEPPLAPVPGRVFPSVPTIFDEPAALGPRRPEALCRLHDRRRLERLAIPPTLAAVRAGDDERETLTARCSARRRPLPVIVTTTHSRPHLPRPLAGGRSAGRGEM